MRSIHLLTIANNSVCSWRKSHLKPWLYHVHLFDAFFGLNGAGCYAVVDDFGNLVKVPS